MTAVVVEPFEKSVSHAPAAATVATIASEAPNLQNEQIVVQGISATVTSDAAAESGALDVVLRDGATGVGAILRRWTLRANTGTVDKVVENGLNIAMTPGNVATLEFIAAGPGTSIERVNMNYFRTGTLG